MKSNLWKSYTPVLKKLTHIIECDREIVLLLINEIVISLPMERFKVEHQETSFYADGNTSMESSWGVKNLPLNECEWAFRIQA